MNATLPALALLLVSVAGACESVAGGRVRDVPEGGALRWLRRPALVQQQRMMPHAGTDEVPFVDRDGNGAYDAFVDPLGFCAAGHSCKFAERRVTVHRLRRNSAGASSAGVFVWAQSSEPGASGGLDLPICDPDESCTSPIRLPFQGIARDVHAVWRCTDTPESEQWPLFRVGGETLQVAMRPHLRVVVAPRSQGVFDITTSESIDHLLVRLVRLTGNEVSDVRWSSDVNPTALQLRSSERATLRIPVEALAGCPECSVMIQALHTWRDDELRDVSEAWLTVPAGGGDA